MSEETKTDNPDAKKAGLELLREPFPPHMIGKLPKPTKQQTDEVRKDFKKGARCKVCGGWHHPKVVHLDYVGHAALTDRLLDCDPEWTWEPLSLDQDGLPRFDKDGGLWIKLTICGITRLGYGDAQGKTGGDAIKEAIGDALRNSGMRFGAALDLWHKGDLHTQDEGSGNSEPQSNGRDVDPETWGERRGQEMLDAMKREPTPSEREFHALMLEDIEASDSADALGIWFTQNKKGIDALPEKMKETLRDKYSAKKIALTTQTHNDEEREHVQ